MSVSTLELRPGHDPIYRALQARHPLSPAEAGVVSALGEGHVRYGAGAEVLAQGQSGAAPLVVARGWAACIRALPDGRRQILRFILPGDLIGLEAGRGPPGWSVTTLTELSAVRAAALTQAVATQRTPGLARALALAVREEERQFLDQIVRLGRMSAAERVASLVLELRDRLMAVGLGDVTQFPCPLTQEMLADALGLSAVHVNRVLKELRDGGLLRLRSGTAHIEDPARMEGLALRETSSQRGMAPGR